MHTHRQDMSLVCAGSASADMLSGLKPKHRFDSRKDPRYEEMANTSLLANDRYTLTRTELLGKKKEWRSGMCRWSPSL